MFELRLLIYRQVILKTVKVAIVVKSEDGNTIKYVSTVRYAFFVMVRVRYVDTVSFKNWIKVRYAGTVRFKARGT